MAINKINVEVTDFLKLHVVPGFKPTTEEEEKSERFQKYISESSHEGLINLADKLNGTGNPEFDELNRELYRLASLVIERAFPKDTEMTPAKLVGIIEEKLVSVL